MCGSGRLGGNSIDVPASVLEDNSSRDDAGTSTLVWD